MTAVRFWERNYGVSIEQICAGVPDKLVATDGELARRWFQRGGQGWLQQFDLRLDVCLATRDHRTPQIWLAWLRRGTPQYNEHVEIDAGTETLRLTVGTLLRLIASKADAGLSFRSCDLIGAQMSFAHALVVTHAQVHDHHVNITTACVTEKGSSRVWLAGRPHPRPPERTLVYLVELLDEQTRNPGLCAAVACSMMRRLHNGSRVLVGQVNAPHKMEAEATARVGTYNLETAPREDPFEVFARQALKEARYERGLSVEGIERARVIEHEFMSGFCSYSSGGSGFGGTHKVRVVTWDERGNELLETMLIDPYGRGHLVERTVQNPRVSMQGWDMPGEVLYVSSGGAVTGHVRYLN